MRGASLSIALAAAIGGTALSAAAKDKAPMTLAPSSPWNAHYAEDSCRLLRSFGTGYEKVTLVIDRLAPADSFRLTLAGRPMRRASAPQTATVQFGSEQPEQELRFYPGTLDHDFSAWIFAGKARIRPYSDAETAALLESGLTDFPTAQISEAEEAAVTQIRIGDPLRQPVILNTGSMKAPFAALRACTDELLTHWGIDVARHRQLSTPALPANSPGDWMSTRDYPQGLMRDGQQGIVNFRLTVGIDGVPTACAIQSSTKPEGFEKAVCSGIMKRARFTPARDAKGEPLVSFYVNTVIFQIPR